MRVNIKTGTARKADTKIFWSALCALCMTTKATKGGRGSVLKIKISTIQNVDYFEGGGQIFRFSQIRMTESGLTFTALIYLSFAPDIYEV